MIIIMARKAREKSESGLYAVLLRGSADIFAADDDREKFMNLLENSNAQTLAAGFTAGCALLCVRESGAGLAADMRSVTIPYARCYNNAHNSSGKIFYGRFKSMPIGENDVQNCIRNIAKLSKSSFVSFSGEPGAEYTPMAFFASVSGEPIKRTARRPTAPKQKPSPSGTGTGTAASKQPEKINSVKKNLPSWLL